MKLPQDLNEPRCAVLLRHECGAQSHYDLMIEDPSAPPGRGRLLTWRSTEPSWRWVELGRVDLEAIEPHRRDYLMYQGPLSGGRGSVSRVDEGTVAIRDWSADGGVLDLRFGRFTGTVELRRAVNPQWVLSIKKGSAT